MSVAAAQRAHGHRAARPRLDGKQSRLTALIFFAILGLGGIYVIMQLVGDLEQAPEIAVLPFVLLVVALFIALGFEFVNGFHDTANAVATVIYTNSLAPSPAVVWSGLCNLAGVMISSGAVAFGIVSLLPVELILQVGSGAGFAMVFALLIAAIIWNLGTWYLGLPSSSSHTLIGSIIGVGIANQLMAPAGTATSGVDWSQASKIGQALLFSPLIGFVAAGALLLLAKLLIRRPELYREPEGNKPPPFWVRCLLILTCTGVSFAHGSNDGQKGMGLIMLILIGTVPTAYALNKAMPESRVVAFDGVATQAADVLQRASGASQPFDGDARAAVGDFLRTRTAGPDTLPAVAALSRDVGQQVRSYRSLSAVPAAAVKNVRNDMYLTDEAVRLLLKGGAGKFSAPDLEVLTAFRSELDNATKFIPDWVKVAVAIALGFGTMVGWKRIVVTVGEKIGKQHLTYAQGASAELVAMTTIGMADMYGLPVSTTHVLSSGVAGTMAANRSGLQWSTIRNLAMAWILTLPVSIALSALLFALFRQVF